MNFEIVMILSALSVPQRLNPTYYTFLRIYLYHCRFFRIKVPLCRDYR
jgi:hypothetical protein